MTNSMREKIDTFIASWEREAKKAMHLDALLHRSIRSKLIDGLVKVFEECASAPQKPAKATPAPKVTEPKAEPVAAPAPVQAAPALQSKRSPEEDAEMARLKAQLASKQPAKKKGKAA